MTQVTNSILAHYQERLAAYLEAGCWDYESELEVVEYSDFEEFVLTMEPPNDYQAAYRLGRIVFLEGCYFDYRANGTVDRIRRERSWNYGSMRAFELTTEVLPASGAEQLTQASIRVTTWYCDRTTGQVVAVRSTFNGDVVTDIRL